MTQAEIIRSIEYKTKIIKKSRDKIAELQNEIDMFAKAQSESFGAENCFSNFVNINDEIIARRQMQDQLNLTIQTSKNDISRLNAQLAQIRQNGEAGDSENSNNQ